ncbi:MAG: C39 family peptidase [Patescibacteria group bacterium]|nr:C39 family peptidase [Patescibacteria group bacterium]
MFKKFKIIFLFIILIILGFVFYTNRVLIKEYFSEPKNIGLPEEVKFEDIIVEEQDVVEIVDEEFSELIKENSESKINEINLDVPFTIQSPDQKWDEFYKEGCEEASILMVYAFVHNQNITVESALKDIGEMIDWQLENYNGHFDLPATTTAEIAEITYGLDTKLIELNSIDDIKGIIETGYPLILPCAGRELKNPNFKQPGPLYHMLVVKGFLANGSIITNDPGTRKGENYIYEADVLWNAIADWNEEIKNPDQNEKIGILLLE